MNNINKLKSLNFVEANKIIMEFVNSQETLSDIELESFLNLNDIELISTFIEKYDRFTESQLIIMEMFVNKNLEITNRDFVSDLIDFSSDWALNVNYKKILDFLLIDNVEEHFVVLSTINYITENTKLLYVKKITERMKGILNNPKFFQNVQISAALCLFRITQKKSYLLEIKDWFIDDEVNAVFLDNKLKLDYYSEEFFIDIRSILFGNGSE